MAEHGERDPGPRWRVPWLRDDRPASVRYPWSRTSLSGLLGLLLPFVWVVEVEECGHGESVELTGASLVHELDPAEPAVWALVAGAITMLAMPWIAAAATREGPRLAAHVVGLLTALGSTLVSVAVLFFTVFAHRTLRPAGYLALLLLGALVVDAVVRLILGAVEWRDARAGGRGPPPRE